MAAASMAQRPAILSLAADIPASPEVTPSDRHLLCLAHPLDPRGQKIGGIETHVRLLLKRAPKHSKVLFLGVDGRGDLELGKIVHLSLGGGAFDFIPVARFSDDAVHKAAKRIWRSQTLQFGLGLIRYFAAIRKALRKQNATVELERYEFSAIFRLLGHPIVQVIHGEGSKDQAMDSLIKKYWVIHLMNKAVAIRLASAIVCVNPTIRGKVKKALPSSRKPIIFMPVPVDSDVFPEQPFDVADNILRIVFVGRLDQFKDPATMFRALRAAWERSDHALEFHYVGTSDPGRYPEFNSIREFSVLHGFRTPAEIATIVGRCHCGLLTSFFEGMPCFLLEALSVGRPFVAVRLPQYDLVIENGVSGYLIDRGQDLASLTAQLATALLALWDEIRSETVSPTQVRAKVQQFSAKSLLTNHLSLHRQLLVK